MKPFLLQACSISKDWYEGAGSRLDLMESSGVADHLEEFNIPAIMECLAAHPDLVAISHTECGDIRGPGGWFFGTTEAGEHIVGVAGGKDIEVFPSELHACAEFIRRQVLDLIGHREHLHALTRPDYRPQ